MPPPLLGFRGHGLGRGTVRQRSGQSGNDLRGTSLASPTAVRWESRAEEFKEFGGVRPFQHGGPQAGEGSRQGESAEGFLDLGQQGGVAEQDGQQATGLLGGCVGGGVGGSVGAGGCGARQGRRLAGGSGAAAPVVALVEVGAEELAVFPAQAAVLDARGGLLQPPGEVGDATIELRASLARRLEEAASRIQDRGLGWEYRKFFRAHFHERYDRRRGAAAPRKAAAPAALRTHRHPRCRQHRRPRSHRAGPLPAGHPAQPPRLAARGRGSLRRTRPAGSPRPPAGRPCWNGRTPPNSLNPSACAFPPDGGWAGERGRAGRCRFARSAAGLCRARGHARGSQGGVVAFLPPRRDGARSMRTSPRPCAISSSVRTTPRRSAG